MRMLSLFSGIGGLDLAAEWAGMETVAFCEIDPFCQKVLKKHWPKVPIYSDIKELSLKDVGPVEIISGGTPCQPFSVAGKHGGTTDDRHLWPEMFRLISGIRPNWVVLENVPGIINVVLDEIQDNLDEEGYKTWTFLLGADLFGAEHRRNRIFVVAEKRAIWPEEYIWEEGWEEPYCPVCGVEFGSPECFHDGITSWFDERVSDDPNTESLRVERLWPKGVEITQSLDKAVLPLRDSNGQWKVEPDFCRVNDGVSRGMDRNKSARLKALGNAVVPQQAYPIFKAIMEVENEY